MSYMLLPLEVGSHVNGQQRPRATYRFTSPELDFKVPFNLMKFFFEEN